MYAQVEKSKENKSRAVANSVTQKKINVKQGFGFVDNRQEVAAQRKPHDGAGNNEQIQKQPYHQGLPKAHACLQMGKKGKNVSSEYKYGTKSDDTHVHAYNKKGGHVKLNGEVFKYGTSGNEMAQAEKFFLENQGKGGLLKKTQEERVGILKWIREWK